MGIDLTDDPAGRATAFATGCAATWVFVRNLVMKPAIKSCHAQIADLREAFEWMRAQAAAKDARITQLETILLQHGNGAIRAAVQSAISENHLEITALKQKVEGK